MAENYSKHGKVVIVGGGRNSGRVQKAHIDLLKELQAYREIGTVEELQALKEKNEPKKVKDIHCDEYYCPSCGSENNCCDAYKVGDKFCPECGQKIDAREEEEYE